MPLASMRSNNLSGSAAGPPVSLFVDSLDVLKEPGTATNRYGVPLDSIIVTENGPGNVSSMSFTIEDPSSAVTVANGDTVLYYDHTNSLPEFRGFVQSFTVSVFGTGRRWEITATGVEALLDWMVLPLDVTFASGTEAYAAVQSLAAQATGVGVALNTAAASGAGFGSAIATPVGKLDSSPPTLSAAVTVTAGTTLREAIRQISDNLTGGLNPATQPIFATVDFWLGLRYFGWAIGVSDYADLTIVDTVTGPIQAADLAHESDAGGVVRGVYVKGGNAAGSGPVSDGSGLPGQWATLEDSTLLTGDARDIAARAYLADKAQSVRGTFARETFTDTSTTSAHIQAGAFVTLTDAQVGLSAASYRIFSISKRYFGARLETWTIAYGGMPPSVARAIRRLTRTTRS
jgi:hypothetical protein